MVTPNPVPRDPRLPAVDPQELRKEIEQLLREPAGSASERLEILTQAQEKLQNALN